jgi:hypothetical protein
VHAVNEVVVCDGRCRASGDGACLAGQGSPNLHGGGGAAAALLAVVCHTAGGADAGSGVPVQGTVVCTERKLGRWPWVVGDLDVAAASHWCSGPGGSWQREVLL